jgi:imidazolonepropionase-like amidohydrolase
VGQALDLPEGTKTIDVTGKRVLPGFVAVQAQGLALASGGGGKVSDSLDPFQEQVKIALACGITSAFVEMGSSGGFFGGGPPPPAGSNAVVKMNYGTLEGMSILEPAAHSLQAWVSGGAADRHEIRQSFLKARDLVEKERDFERRRVENKLKPNEQSVRAADPFARMLRGELIARMSASDADAIRRALELVNEFRFRCVLMDVVEGWTLPDEIGRARAYVVLTVRTKQHADRRVARPSGSSIEQAAILRKAGVKFAISPITPAVTTGGIAGRDLTGLPIEAAFAVRGGLDEAAALEAITLTAAEVCGVESRVGSIEEGKDADLVVLDGDPLDYRTFVDLTFVNGKLLYEKSKSSYFNHLKGKGR